MKALHEALRLVVVTDRKRVRGSLLEVVRAALRGGATCVQLREKDLGARDLLALARPIREATEAASALFVINDRVDVALAAGADGVQLGWRSLSVAEARRIVGPAHRIGASTHEASEIVTLQGAGADFVTFGPVYDTPSKRGLVTPRGVRGLRSAVLAAGGLPVVALGGIREGRVAELRLAGACGIAVLSRVMASQDPEGAVRRLLEEWSAASAELA